jgi:hypothetical protein
MFEEGLLLKKRFGAENVFDLSIGNPIIEPPAEFNRELKRLANSGNASIYGKCWLCRNPNGRGGASITGDRLEIRYE